jgi:hypothetical protein
MTEHLASGVRGRVLELVPALRAFPSPAEPPPTAALAAMVDTPRLDNRRK